MFPLPVINEKVGGGLHNGRGSQAEGGVVLTQEVQVLAMLKVGTKSCHPLKGEGAKSFRPTISPFCSLPSP